MARERNVSSKELLRTLFFPVGILLAVVAQYQPQRVRLGPTWIKNKDGTVAVVRPTELRFGDYARWVLQEARHHALEGVLGVASGPRTDESRPLEEYEDRSEASNALKVLMSAERAMESVGIFETLDRMAAPRERELLTLLQSGTEPADLPARMGLSPSTIRVLRHRLLRKARQLVNAST